MYNSANKHVKMSKFAWVFSARGKRAQDDENDYSEYKKDGLSWVGGGGCGPVQPGETKETWFDLFEAYPIEHPGKYSVWVSRADNAVSVGTVLVPDRQTTSDMDTGHVTIKSNAITVTVTGPRERE